MKKKDLASPILEKYLLKYEENPRSRVFAPLAESYRKLGLIKDALIVLKNGITHNPDYIMGYVGLAKCYDDTKKFEMVYSTLKPYVSSNRDNISMQKIFAKSCKKLSLNEEALDTYKYLLFMNPKDPEVAKNVSNLEKSVLALSEPVKKKSNFNIENINATPLFEDSNDWSHVNFKTQKIAEEPIIPKVEDIDTHTDNADEFAQSEDNREEVPFLTHSLIDLYIAQGHKTKAIELLNKYLDASPNNQKLAGKLAELTSTKSDKLVIKHVVTTQDSGHDYLMKVIDEEIFDQKQTVAVVDNSAIILKLDKFLSAIHKRSENYLN